MALGLLSRKKKKKASSRQARRMSLEGYEPAETIKLPADTLERCFKSGRLGLIAMDREHWRNHPEYDAVRREAIEAINDRFGLVPAGYVSLAQSIGEASVTDELDVETEPFLLSCHAVTQAQFQHFVDDGGYEQLELWPQDIWPHLIDFVDMTGQSGPRFWRGGRHDKRLGDHPVVGICYYEAAAYAAWAGYRLPTEAQWQMAACWRIRSSAYVFRRYPWGDALDTDRCNIWASNVGGTVGVDDYNQGAAPNGVVQLIGNVWEWTASDFTISDDQNRQIVGDMLMKSIRGGAFDTYFACQATSYFRTGLATLIRAHNVGFRCAVDMIDDDSDSQGEE